MFRGEFTKNQYRGGGGVPKKGWVGGQFADLRGAWQERGGWCWYSDAHYVVCLTLDMKNWWRMELLPEPWCSPTWTRKSSLKVAVTLTWLLSLLYLDRIPSYNIPKHSINIFLQIPLFYYILLLQLSQNDYGVCSSMFWHETSSISSVSTCPTDL